MSDLHLWFKVVIMQLYSVNRYKPSSTFSAGTIGAAYEMNNDYASRSCFIKNYYGDQYTTAFTIVIQLATYRFSTFRGQYNRLMDVLIDHV